MKVILCQNVRNLGSMGATVNVADGYARNFLIPRKLAVSADSASARQIEHEMRNIRKREERLVVELKAVAKQMEALTLEIKARAGEEEKIFGSVTNVAIAEALREKGFDVDRRSIHLDEPIKSLGIYTVPVRLGNGVDATVKVWVVAEQPEPQESSEEEAETETESSSE